MHRVFQASIDGLVASGDTERLRPVLADAGAPLDLSCFAYLSMPSRRGDAPELISNYPVEWTDHYLLEHYEPVDPVIVEALTATEPFEWGQEFTAKGLSKPQCALLDEAAQFGIRCGFTVPVHDSRGPVAAVTFAADERRPAFQRCIEHNRSVLQLMAMYFHAHARRRLSINRVIDGVALSPRELECLEWAAHGKSAWEIGRLLNISRRTAAFHSTMRNKALFASQSCYAAPIGELSTAAFSVKERRARASICQGNPEHPRVQPKNNGKPRE